MRRCVKALTIAFCALQPFSSNHKLPFRSPPLPRFSPPAFHPQTLFSCVGQYLCILVHISILYKLRYADIHTPHPRHTHACDSESRVGRQGIESMVGGWEGRSPSSDLGAFFFNLISELFIFFTVALGRIVINTRC